MELFVPVQTNGYRQTVNARDLHEHLGVGRDFTNWIKGRIKKYGFIEDQDFTPVLAKTSKGSAGGRPEVEYHITLGMAKELCMVENNEVGRKTRQYFIAVEEDFNNYKKVRGESIDARNSFTDTLSSRGYIQGYHYIQTTVQMKNALGIKVKKKEMTKEELLAVTTAEKMAETAISISKAKGFHQVNPLCVKAADTVQDFIDSATRRKVS